MYLYINIIYVYYNILYILCNKGCVRLKTHIYFIINYWKQLVWLTRWKKTVVKHTSECRPTIWKLLLQSTVCNIYSTCTQSTNNCHSEVRIFRLRHVSARVRQSAPVSSQFVSRNAINAVTHACGRQLLVTVFKTKFPSASQYPTCKYMLSPPPFSSHKLQQPQKVNFAAERVALYPWRRRRRRRRRRRKKKKKKKKCTLVQALLLATGRQQHRCIIPQAVNTV